MWWKNMSSDNIYLARKSEAKVFKKNIFRKNAMNVNPKRNGISLEYFYILLNLIPVAKRLAFQIGKSKSCIEFFEFQAARAAI